MFCQWCRVLLLSAVAVAVAAAGYADGMGDLRTIEILLVDDVTVAPEVPLDDAPFWEGEVQLSDGQLVRVGGVKLTPSLDSVLVDGRWRISPKRYFYDRWPKITQKPDGEFEIEYRNGLDSIPDFDTDKMPAMNFKGVTVSTRAPGNARMRIDTSLGGKRLSLDRLALGEPMLLDDNKMLVQRLPGYYAFDRTDEYEDYPVVTVDAGGVPFIAYVTHAHHADSVNVAMLKDDTLVPLGMVAGPGNMTQPAIACAPDNTVWVIWSEKHDDGWALRARAVTGEGFGEPIEIAAGNANHIFADAGTDANGRIWVVWQTFDVGPADIQLSWRDPGSDTWEAPTKVTDNAVADWEPRLAFGPHGALYITYDTYEAGNYDVRLFMFRPGAQPRTVKVTNSPKAEFRSTATAGPDGKTVWLAWEEGFEKWGKRSKGAGLRSGRRMRLARYDAARDKLTMLPDINNLVPAMEGFGAELPELVLDDNGCLWLFFRYFNEPKLWRAAFSKFDPKTNLWARPVNLPESAYSADRRCSAVKGKDGLIWVTWPSDKRASRQAGDAGVFLAPIKIDEAFRMVDTRDMPDLPPDRFSASPDLPPLDLNERHRADRHTWDSPEGKYKLYWGDLHRHTDMSVCAQNNDGAIIDHFRYALDATELDFLGTADHIQHMKVITDYEWWEMQTKADLFQVPGYFNSFYAYERSQRWPYGHRNVVYLKRGGPLIMRTREGYLPSAPIYMLNANAGYPGEQRIRPEEMWEILDASGYRAVTLAHTIADPTMGTDWGVYEKIDQAYENVVEIYQGHRVSYEGVGVPQPMPPSDNLAERAAGNTVNEMRKALADSSRPEGMYQNALSLGYKLGVFTSSDHMSTHISFGGAYVTDFSREGIFDAIDARRTIAATEKIFMEFTCNGKLMGEVFETQHKPELTIRVDGTNPLSRVAIIRNEKEWRTFAPNTDPFEITTTDEAPLAGENRYYVRVQQVDGHLGWTSPVWVTYTGR